MENAPKARTVNGPNSIPLRIKENGQTNLRGKAKERIRTTATHGKAVRKETKAKGKTTTKKMLHTMSIHHHELGTGRVRHRVHVRDYPVARPQLVSGTAPFASILKEENAHMETNAITFIRQYAHSGKRENVATRTANSCTKMEINNKVRDRRPLDQKEKQEPEGRQGQPTLSKG